MLKISIIDSGLSNLYNVSQAFEYIGAKTNIVLFALAGITKTTATQGVTAHRGRTWTGRCNPWKRHASDHRGGELSRAYAAFYNNLPR